jgi:hypothetical protein
MVYTRPPLASRKLPLKCSSVVSVAGDGVAERYGLTALVGSDQATVRRAGAGTSFLGVPGREAERRRAVYIALATPSRHIC